MTEIKTRTSSICLGRHVQVRRLPNQNLVRADASRSLAIPRLLLVSLRHILAHAADYQAFKVYVPSRKEQNCGRTTSAIA